MDLSQIRLLSAEVGLLKWINKLKPLLDAYQEIFLNAGLDYLCYWYGI